MDYYGYPEYPQLHPPFEHAVTILDLLFNTGPDAPRYMKSFRRGRDASLSRSSTHVERYYSARFAEHGATRAGRRLELGRVAGAALRAARCASSDGRGAVLGHRLRLRVRRARRVPHATRLRRSRYSGFDVSAAMLEQPAQRSPSADGVRFVRRGELEPADYSVASGIFNVRLGIDETTWRAYVDATIERLDALGAARLRLQHADLVLRPRADARRTSTTPTRCAFFDRCKRAYSRHVALLHDYGLWEFTIVVRRTVARADVVIFGTGDFARVARVYLARTAARGRRVHRRRAATSRHDELAGSRSSRSRRSTRRTRRPSTRCSSRSASSGVNKARARRLRARARRAATS